MPSLAVLARAYRIGQGQFVAFAGNALIAQTVRGVFGILYDDGSSDELIIDTLSISAGQQGFYQASVHPAKQDGWIVTGTVVQTGTAGNRGTLYGRILIVKASSAGELDVVQEIARGDLYAAHDLSIGVFTEQTNFAMGALDVTYTQGNVAGGAVKVDVIPGANSEMVLVDYTATNSGTNAISVVHRDVNNAQVGLFESIASGAGTSAIGGFDTGASTKTSGQTAGIARL